MIKIKKWLIAIVLFAIFFIIGQYWFSTFGTVHSLGRRSSLGPSFLGRRSSLENFETGIPKIIHQTAPSDKSKWKSEWSVCQNSWKTHFPEPEYKHMMWTDDDLDNIVKNDYPWYYDTFKSYDSNIKRIDIARYFILHKHGGIYADMDYMTTKNFYSDLPQDKITLPESPFKQNEYVQNSLMASPPEHPFWMKVIDRAKGKINDPVLFSTGPGMLTTVYEENKDVVNVLPQNLYNPKTDSPEFNSPDVVTKHLCTASWT